MKRTRILGFFAGVAIVALGATACTNVQRGAAAGGLIGAPIGYYIAGNGNHLSDAQGVLIGGATGAAVGGLAGDAYDQVTEKDKDRELANLRQQLADAEAELDRCREQQTSADADALAQRDRRIADLERQLADGNRNVRSAAPLNESEEMARLRRETELANQRASEAERRFTELSALLNDLCNRISQPTQ